jgi:hypothetical protein
MNGLADYIVLDDVKNMLAECVLQNLNPNAKNMDTKELLRPLEAWEVNPKCTRSIKYHHHNSFRKKHQRRSTTKPYHSISLLELAKKRTVIN